MFIFFTNFSRLPEDFGQTCTLEFSSFQGYWLPEGILVLKMKNDSLNTIVQFRGIMHPRRLCWLSGASAVNTEPHPFCGDAAAISLHRLKPRASVCQLILREYLFLRWFWPPAVWMGLPSHLLQEVQVQEEGLGVVGCQLSRRVAEKSFFWVAALHGSWHFNMSGNWCSDGIIYLI